MDLGVTEPVVNAEVVCALGIFKGPHFYPLAEEYMKLMLLAVSVVILTMDLA